jgi:hypothetical protein
MSAEAQIDALLQSAELEAARLRDQSRSQAQATLDLAQNEAAQVRAEATALRAAAEERMREVQRIEAEFNEALGRLVERIGAGDRPPEGWLRRITGGR